MFCGQTGKMTKEHAWPQWLGRDATVEPRRHTYTSGFHRSDDDTLTEKPNQAVHRNGSVLTQVVREVCATCNNGWMSRLEEGARPLLERLWAPSYPLGTTTFAAADVATVAAWATKTAWINERHTSRGNTADASARQRFASNLRQPPHTNVWAARHVGEQDFHALTASIEVSHNAQHWQTGEYRHVHLCTLRFRGLCFVVRTDSGAGVPPMRLPADAWRLLTSAEDSEAAQHMAVTAGQDARPREVLLWPPDRPITDQEGDWVARNVSSWLRMPATTRFVRSGDWRHQHHN